MQASSSAAATARKSEHERRQDDKKVQNMLSARRTRLKRSLVHQQTQELARKLQEDVKAANEQVSTLQEALQTSQGRMQEWQQVAIESRIERAAVLEQLYVMQAALVGTNRQPALGPPQGFPGLSGHPMQCSDLASLQQSLSPGLQQSLHPGLQPPGPPQMAPAQAQAQVPAHLGPQFLQAGLQMFGRPDLSPHIKQALLSAWQLPPLPSDTPGMAALQPHSSLHSLQGPPTPLAGQVRAGRVPLFPHAGLEAELLQSCGHSAPPYSHSPLADPGPLAPDLLCNTGPLTRALQASELGPTASAAGGLELPVRSAPTSLQSHSATPHTPAHADEAQAPAVGGVPRCEAANTPGQDQATPCTRAQAAAQLPAGSAGADIGAVPLSTPRCGSAHDIFGLASGELDMLLTSSSTWGAM